MKNKELIAQDTIFHAIGRFVVSYSSFHSYCELMVSHLLAPHGTQEDHRRAQIVLSDLTSQPVVDSFFALLSELNQSQWSKTDLQIVKLTRKAANTIIQKRNRISHDIWHLGHPNLLLPEGVDAFRIISRRSTTKGLLKSNEPVTLEGLNNLTGETEDVRDSISLLTICALDPTKRPSDFLELASEERVKKVKKN